MSLNPEDLEIEEDMRKRTLDMLSADWEAVSHFLNRFFFWRGMLSTEAQVDCHNSAEAFVIWIMGGKAPTNIDPRYVEQLETLMGYARPIDRKLSGSSYIAKDKPRRRKVTDV